MGNSFKQLSQLWTHPRQAATDSRELERSGQEDILIIKYIDVSLTGFFFQKPMRPEMLKKMWIYKKKYKRNVAGDGAAMLLLWVLDYIGVYLNSQILQANGTKSGASLALPVRRMLSLTRGYYN